MSLHHLVKSETDIVIKDKLQGNMAVHLS